MAPPADSGVRTYWILPANPARNDSIASHSSSIQSGPLLFMGAAKFAINSANSERKFGLAVSSRKRASMDQGGEKRQAGNVRNHCRNSCSTFLRELPTLLTARFTPFLLPPVFLDSYRTS